MNNDNKQRMSGMPCPNCRNFIPISMMQMIEAKGITCPICGLINLGYLISHEKYLKSWKK